MFKALNLPDMRNKVRLLADKRGSNFVNDSEIDSLLDDSFHILYNKILRQNEGYFLKETEPMKPVNQNELPLPDDLYKVRMLQRYDSFKHYIREVPLQQVASLDSSYYAAYYGFPTIYAYVLFPDRIKLYPTSNAADMTFKIYYSRDPLAVANESLQVGWEKYLSYKTAYKIGVIEENPRASLGDLALQFEKEIIKTASQRNTGIRTVLDAEESFTGTSFY